MSDPMTEAVKAAAWAIHNLDWRWTYGRDDPSDRQIAEAAVNAALPILRAQFAEEVALAIVYAPWEEGSKVGPLPGDDQETWIRGANAGVDLAAAIARNWGTK